jgi:hypothetical protein
MNPLIGAIGVTSILSTVLVLIIFSVSRSVALKKVMRWVAIYSAVSFASDMMLQLSTAESNFPLLFTFTLVEYACFAWIFYMLLSKPLHQKIIVVGSFAFLTMVSVTLGNYGSKHFDNVNSATEAILIIVYSILYFSEKLRLDNPEPIFDSPGSFVVIACLFYLAGNLFLFITSEEQSSSVWIINSCFNMIKNIFFLVAIRKCTRMKKPVSSFHFS